MVPGTQGYAEQADELIPRYEGETFETKHSALVARVIAAALAPLNRG